MKIEIEYEPVPDEEFEEILKDCSRMMMELFIDSLKEKNISKE